MDPAPISVKRAAATFGLATVLGHASQLVWLAAASRAMSPAAFGSVLAAQALYAVLQVVVDVGPNAVGSRMAARGELADERRHEILRMRLIIALAATAPALALGALNVSGSLTATLPFVVALWLFAALNVWEPYGLGDARPWATYTFLRSASIALAACAFLVADARFPVALAGALECVAIVAVMLGYRRTSPVRLASVARARGGPWRSVFSIGGPAVMAQSSLAAGTLVLSGAGRPVAAGIFAACVRLLSGVNAINGVVATSLYPRLARSSAADSVGDLRVVSGAVSLIALAAAGATALCALFGAVIATAFLGADSRPAVAALVLTMAAALPLGNVVMFTFAMLARGHERAAVVPSAIGGVVTIALAFAVVATTGGRVDLVAGSLLIGQLVSMAGLGARLRRVCPDLWPAAARAMAVASLVASLAGLSLVPGCRAPAGLALLAVAAIALTSFRRSA